MRPEKIALVLPGAAAPLDAVNRADGVVYRRSFLGGMMRCVIRIAPESLVTVDIPNAAGAHVPEIDEHVALAWSPADTLILGADPP
jgi:hypothetical protein